jgi:hypothetical protein
MGHFHVRDLEMVLKGQPRSKVLADFEPPGSSSH